MPNLQIFEAENFSGFLPIIFSLGIPDSRSTFLAIIVTFGKLKISEPY
jgi:hypothetical protein